MANKTRHAVALTAAMMLVGAAVAGCSDSKDDAGSADGTERISITVGNLPSEQSPDERATYMGVIEAFETDNPDIDLVPEEVSYDPQTFQALLAGGTMPMVMDVPFTDTQALIARGQVRDVTEQFKAEPALTQINPALLTSAQDAEGHNYGVPSTAYSMAIVVNRALFAQAGLDPDVPFDSWDDLRAAAKTITEKTGEAGLGVATKDNQGGWLLTAQTYAWGGQLEELDGDTYTATVDNAGTTQALEFLKALRWEDNSLGSNFLVNIDDIYNGLAGGQYGMMIAGSDAYWPLVVSRDFPDTDFGLLPMPQDADGLGTLGGGGYMVVNPKASDAEAAAAMKWAAYKFQRFTNEEAAKKYAEQDSKAGFPVPQMGIPMVDSDAYQAYLGYVADYINVPMDNIKPYNDSVDAMPLVPEPPIEAQQVYSALDPVVQAVLTDQNADVAKLLGDAQAKVGAIVASAQK